MPESLRRVHAGSGEKYFPVSAAIGEAAPAGVAMFGIGAGELFVIFIIAIVVIGPKQLPDVARTIGKLFVTFKRTGNQLRDQMHEEVKKFQEMEEIKEFRSSIESEISTVKDTAEEYIKSEIDQEEQRFRDEAKNLERELTAEGGPLSPEVSAALGTGADPAPGESAEREAPAAADPQPAAAADPAAEAEPEALPAKGANGSAPAHSTPNDAAATAPAEKLLS
jgi:Tat protein translocase TatB subunit